MSIELTDNFWSKVRKTDTCWYWTGARNSKGRPCWSVKTRSVLAHRVAYEALVGPISAGLTIDHICLNPICVNTAHMELVTRAENVRRYWAWKRGEVVPEYLRYEASVVELVFGPIHEAIAAQRRAS